MGSSAGTGLPRQSGAGDRDLTYDWLRLIATLCVVVGHSFYTRITETSGGVYYTLPENVHPAYFSLIWDLLSRVAVWVYDFHMPLFFLLSGAVVALRPLPPVGKVIAGRACRLLLPYVLCGLAYMLPVKFLGGFYNGAGLAAAYRGFLLGYDSGHLWFLPALFWCAAVFALLAKLLAPLGRWQPLALLAVSALASWLAGLAPGDLFLFCRGMGYLVWFALGYCFQLLRSRCRPWPLWQALTALAALLALQYLNVRFGMLGSFARALAGCALAFVGARCCTLLLPGLAATGLWRRLVAGSFAVYLFHDPLEYLVLRLFFTGDLLATAAGCCGYYLARLVGVVAVSLLLDRLVQLVKNALRIRRKAA